MVAGHEGRGVKNSTQGVEWSGLVPALWFPGHSYVSAETDSHDGVTHV